MVMHVRMLRREFPNYKEVQEQTVFIGLKFQCLLGIFLFCLEVFRLDSILDGLEVIGRHHHVSKFACGGIHLVDHGENIDVGLRALKHTFPLTTRYQLIEFPNLDRLKLRVDTYRL